MVYGSHLLIAFNEVIENAKGGFGSERITGNKHKNNIQGNGGNDTINGSDDYDIATYSGNFLDYSFSIANELITISDNRLSTNNGIDSLSNIEKLPFTDQNAFDTSKEIKVNSFLRLPIKQTIPRSK